MVLLGHASSRRWRSPPGRPRAPPEDLRSYGQPGGKGFAQVVKGRTKLFSAVEPKPRLPSWLEHKRTETEHELENQQRSAGFLAHDLADLYSQGKGGRGTLDFLYRRMLAAAQKEYLEFSRPRCRPPPCEKLRLPSPPNGTSPPPLISAR